MVRSWACGGAECQTSSSRRAVAVVTKVHMDYGFLQEAIIEEEEEFTESSEVRASMTVLIVLETMCDSVWTYATAAKGYQSDPWLPKKIHDDLTTVGLGLVRIVVKTDTEAAILDLRREMSKHRGGTHGLRGLQGRRLE